MNKNKLFSILIFIESFFIFFLIGLFLLESSFKILLYPMDLTANHILFNEIFLWLISLIVFSSSIFGFYAGSKLWKGKEKSNKLTIIFLLIIGFGFLTISFLMNPGFDFIKQVKFIAVFMIILNAILAIYLFKTNQ
ncbi:MAG: hypothetical protein Q7S33_01580 [Nanoarchaeota archaeon]|nr:hypothetical protein [Nanoarchaeota archaeon]